MSMTCPIVTIETENGPVDINESDYDSAVHTLYRAESNGPNKGTVAWYKQELDATGIEYPADSNKATLEMIYDGSNGA